MRSALVFSPNWKTVGGAPLGPLIGRRWVLGHISVLTPRDIERIARMGIVLTTHTNRNIYKEGHLLQQRLPKERHREITFDGPKADCPGPFARFQRGSPMISRT
jgi:hypothetical protein